MPRGDRSGPMGLGSMTGRGAGFCTGNTVPGCMNAIPGNGGGFGRGLGRGYGRGRGGRQGWAFQGAPFAAQPVSVPQVDELTALKRQVKSYNEALQSINGRIAELESEQK